MKPLRPDQWQLLKPILDHAAGLLESERCSYLDRQLSGRPILRDYAAKLLQNQGAFQTLTKNARLCWRPPAEREDDRVGMHIGPYFLRESLGSGGMGVVYLAERNLEGVTQKVALKVLKRGLDTDAILHRFHHERQILARLDHPYIATMLDGGTTSDHLPYFVMTLVQGQTLFDYCQTAKPSLEARLELFRKICQAVHFAHQNLVVHRDLKPGNLLITETGEPRLLDFGIAKCLAPQDQDTRNFTELGHRALTPDYASPEQIRQGAVTTASDLYTLGILFYELIAGVKPFQDPRTGASPAWDEHKFESWVKPSTRLSQALANGFRHSTELGDAFGEQSPQMVRRRVRNLRGDLDNLARKAMQVQPNQRYSSAVQFADDVARFLAGRPIMARPASFSYVALKWFGRHKLAVSFSLALMLIALVFSMFTRFQHQRLLAQQNLASAALQKSQDVSRFMAEIFAAGEPFEGDLCDATAEMLVHQAARKFAEDRHIPPRIKAELMESVAGIYQAPHLLADSEKQLCEALAQQIDRSSSKPEVVAGIHHTFAHYHLNKGDLQKAMSQFEIARSIYKSKVPAADNSLADIASALGEIARMNGDHAAAMAHQERALSMMEKDPGNVGEVAKFLKRLAAAERRTGNLAKAAVTLEKALRLLATHPDYSVARAEIQTDLGLAYLQLRRLDEAEAIFQEGIQLRSKLFGPRSLWTAYHYNQLGWTYVAKGWFADSEAAFEAAYRIRKHHLAPNHADVLDSQKNLAGNHILTGKFIKAEQLLSPMIAAVEQGSESCNLTQTELFLYAAQMKLGRNSWDDAERLLDRATIGLQWHQGSSPALFGQHQSHLGMLALGRGQYLQAQHHLNIAAFLFESRFGERNIQVGRVWLRLCALFFKQEQFEMAERYASQAFEVFSENPEANAPFLGESLKCLGDIAMARSNYLEGRELYSESLTFMLKGYGHDSPKTEAMNLALK